MKPALTVLGATTLAFALIAVSPTRGIASPPAPSTPPDVVVPIPHTTAVSWPVQSIVGVQDMHFSSTTLDGSVTETDDGRLFVLTADVMFAYNKAKLTKKAKSTLTGIATQLPATPPAQISVTGFTDSDGSAAANRTLSKKRAKAVATFLAARLGSTTTITAAGKGESHPRASNATKAGRALNRRVEITIPS
jgi:outer membrane protein OmpA-like peptidoglycan-associated protein